MAAPALWIGLGGYGADAVAELERRRAALVSPFLEGISARPCVLWTAASTTPGSTPPELGSRVLASLPQSTRRGNMRGPCYLLVVAHVDDLANRAELADPDHWIWSLPRNFDFTGSRLVLLACTDGVRASGIDERSRAAWARLGTLDAAVREAGTRGDGFGQVLTVQGTAPGSGGLPASLEAVSLLADILNAVWDDPDADSTFGQLLGTGLVRFPEPAPPTGDPMLVDGYRTFGIRAARYDVDAAIRDLTDAVASTLQRAARDPAPSHPEGFGPAQWRPDTDSIPLPAVPTKVPALIWPADARFAESSAELRARIDDAEARIRTELPGWWRAQLESTRVDASTTRAHAISVLYRGAEDLERALEELWSSGGGLANVHAFVEDARTAIGGAMPRVPDERVPPPAVPSFGVPIERLRRAAVERPAPASVLAVLVVALGAAVVVGFGVGIFVVDRLSVTDPTARGVLTIMTISIMMLLAGAYPALAWFLRPWRRIKRAERGVQNQLATATVAIQRYRSALAEYVRAQVQLEVLAQFRARADRASVALLDFSRGLDDMLSAGEMDGPARPCGVLETLVTVPVPVSAADELCADLFGRFVPDALIEDRGAQVPIARAFLRETIRGLASDRVRKAVVAQPVDREVLGTDEPHLLGAVGGSVNGEVHVSRRDRQGPSTSPEGQGRGALVRADLSWPDRAFWLVSASTTPIGTTAPRSQL